MKIGVLGCGKQAEKHVAALKKIPGVEVIVADVVKGYAEAMAKQFDVRAYPAPEAVLADDRVEVIDICVPTAWHRQLIIEGLASNKHVFCEKPLCRNLGEALEIQAAYQGSDRVLMVGYHHRFHPAYRTAKEALENGVVGKPYLAMFRMGGRGSHRQWKHRHSEGGGAFYEIFVHKLALISWYFGPITRAELLLNETFLPTRAIGPDSVEVDAEDCVLVRLQCDGNLTAICQSDLLTPGFMDYMEVQGDNGSIFTSMFQPMPTIVFCNEPRGGYSAGYNKAFFETYDLFQLELEHFLKTIAGEAAPECTLGESVEMMRVLHGLTSESGCYQSAAQELRVER